MAGQTAKQNTHTPRIYVASLADYVSGRLHGVWLEATDIDVVQEGVAKMLKASREAVAEEVAIHDHENFGAYPVGEYDSLAVVCAVGAAIAEHGTVFADYVAHVGSPHDPEDVAGLVERFQESYQGAFRSLVEWGEQFLEDTGSLNDVPEPLRNYIDFEGWADDAEMNGDVFTVEDGGEVHVFWAR
jgi:antirestriction protein